MKIKILVVAFSLALFGLGVAVGLTLPADEENDRIIVDIEKQEEFQEVEKITALLSLGVIDGVNMNLSGEVIVLNNESITLLINGNKIEIAINNETDIARWIARDGHIDPSERIEIEGIDISPGEVVGIDAVVMIDGTLLARGISTSELEE